MCWWKTKREPLAIPGSCSTATRMLRCQSVEIITVGPHSTLDLRSHLATTQALLPFVRSRVASAVAGFDSEGWNRRNPIQNEVYPYKKQLMLLKKTLMTVGFTTEINYNWMDWHNWWLVAVFRFHISWKDASSWWEKKLEMSCWITSYTHAVLKISRIWLKTIFRSWNLLHFCGNK
jgi:hypothetical protein